MKKGNRTIMVTSILVMLVIWIFIAVEKGTELFKGLDLVIFILIVGLGIIAFFNSFKKSHELKEGQPPEDEFSKQIKYKSGHYAYYSTMYIWCIIFLFKYQFPNLESLVGGGILLSGLSLFISKLIVKKQLYAK